MYFCMLYLSMNFMNVSPRYSNASRRFRGIMNMFTDFEYDFVLGIFCVMMLLMCCWHCAVYMCIYVFCILTLFCEYKETPLSIYPLNQFFFS